MKQKDKETLKKGDKYILTDGIMKHLIGKTVTIEGYRGESMGKKFYNVTIDDMNNCPLVCSEKVLEKL